MDQLIDIVRFVTIGCLLVIIIQLLRYSTKFTGGFTSAAFALCCTSYLLVDWNPIQDYGIFYLFLIPTVSLPYVFWIFSQSIFNDDFNLKSWMIWTWGGILIVQLSIIFISREQQVVSISGIETPLNILHQAISLIFVTLAIAVALQHREADLIIARFRFRNMFVIFTAGLILFTVLSEAAFQGQDVPGWLELNQKLFIAILAYYFAFQRLELKTDFFAGVKITSKKIHSSTSDKTLIEKLNHYIVEQKGWKTESLSIKRLSENLGIKEYKLRQAINQHLGFRNFNDFLHSYRIEEACRLLTDPNRKDLTILEIAYEIGYSSLAPFNKAFKQITGMTPTEWRRSQIGNSPRF